MQAADQAGIKAVISGGIEEKGGGQRSLLHRPVALANAMLFAWPCN